MRAHNYPKVCAFCEKDFLGFRPNSKYCSDTCRYAWQSRNQSEKTKARRQEYQKKWGTENWQRKRDYMIKYTYGLEPEQYQQMLEQQNHCCAICRRHETEFARKLAVDHDHKTNEIYGLLCQDCNHVLVGRHRDPQLFEAAAFYLQKGTGWFVPTKKSKKRSRKVSQKSKRGLEKPTRRSKSTLKSSTIKIAKARFGH